MRVSVRWVRKPNSSISLTARRRHVELEQLRLDVSWKHSGSVRSTSHAGAT